MSRFVLFLPFTLATVEISGSLDFTLPSDPKAQQKPLPLPDVFTNKIRSEITITLSGSPGQFQTTKIAANTNMFTFYDVEEGSSYIITAEHPEMAFKPIRVDVNSKGSKRVRVADFITPSKVDQLSYPLKFQISHKPQWFQQRQQINIVGAIMANPMILLMGFSFVLMLVLPKMVDMNDPEVKAEIEKSSIGKMFNPNKQQQQMPDVTEWFASNFGGHDAKSLAKKKK